MPEAQKLPPRCRKQTTQAPTPTPTLTPTPTVPPPSVEVLEQLAAGTEFPPVAFNALAGDLHGVGAADMTPKVKVCPGPGDCPIRKAPYLPVAWVKVRIVSCRASSTAPSPLANWPIPIVPGPGA